MRAHSGLFCVVHNRHLLSKMLYIVHNVIYCAKCYTMCTMLYIVHNVIHCVQCWILCKMLCISLSEYFWSWSLLVQDYSVLCIIDICWIKCYILCTICNIVQNVIYLPLRIFLVQDYSVLCITDICWAKCYTLCKMLYIVQYVIHCA